MPLLKKVISTATAGVFTGIIWSIWHLPLILTNSMAIGHTHLTGILIFTVGIIAISYILAILSDYKIGRSIWTYVSFHAIYNIIGMVVQKMVTADNLKYLDEAGYYITVFIVVAAIYTFIFTQKSKNGLKVKELTLADH